MIRATATPRRRAAGRFSILGMAALLGQRRRLAALDADRLADIGVTRDEALREARRLPWDAPARACGPQPLAGNLAEAS